MDESRCFFGFQKGDEIKFDIHSGQSWILFFPLLVYFERKSFDSFGVISGWWPRGGCIKNLYECKGIPQEEHNNAI